MFRLIDTLESERGASVIKEDIYLMRGYCDNEMADRQIDSFVCSITEFEKYEYDQLLISFFKESSLSNMKKFQENARDLIRYSVDKDLIYNYSFHEKYRPMYRYTYKGTYISEKYDLNCQRFKKGKKETF
ncbi:MAG: hypothetical protein DHS20C18_35080 [Saprospiraceae bacterium]|nr:MAG: hypothetical protein DHS20C18_35080 [Saprospiraceae bacterium]